MNNIITKKSALLGLSSTAVIVLGACSSSSDFDFERSVEVGRTAIPLQAGFDPQNGVLPFPNNLLFRDSEDGTLNVPLTNADGTTTPSDTFADPRVALNALDGFSTVEAFSTSFAQAGNDTPTQGLNPATLIIGDTVRVFEVALVPGAPLPIPGAIVAELTANDLLATTDAVNAARTEAAARALADAQGIEIDEASIRQGDPATLIIAPRRPLKESTTYMAVVMGADTSSGVPVGGVRDALGQPISAPATFSVAIGTESLADTPLETAERLRQFMRPMIDVLEAATLDTPLNTNNIAMAWTATTQSTTPVLNAVAASTVSRPINIMPSGLDTTAIGIPADNSFADIWAGAMQVPDYTGIDAPLSNFWVAENGGFLTRFNPTPRENGLQTIPVLMTVPNRTEMPEGGWPIAIFQHGITRNRLDMFGIADQLAAAGVATIAIDLPTHGIVGESPLRNPAVTERTFDLDAADNTTLAPLPGGDGMVDPSGTHFYNLTNLLNTRSNMLQSVSDLLTLSASVGTIPVLNVASKSYIGHSLGAIVGTTFLAFDDSITSATLASPGGSVVRLLQNSPAFGPAITGALSQLAPVTTPTGQQFLTTAQAVVDAADPINHASRVLANTNVHLSQMLQDVVVIGSQPEFPLVGTEPLARTMGLEQVSVTTSGSGWVQFIEGNHGTIIDFGTTDENPIPDPSSIQFQAASELQMQAIGFALSGGANLAITNEALIQDAP